MNGKLNYPVATLLMAATSQAQEQIPETYRPFLMMAVLLLGYVLHIFDNSTGQGSQQNTSTSKQSG